MTHMNKTVTMLLAALAIGPAAASTSVGVSIGINQPGVYGRIDIGNVPHARLHAADDHLAARCLHGAQSGLPVRAAHASAGHA